MRSVLLRRRGAGSAGLRRSRAGDRHDLPDGRPLHGGRAQARPSRSTSRKFAFGPKEITVAPGTRIVWTNHDEAPHTVTSNDKSFASKGLDTDDKFEHTFTDEGDFDYLCTVHPFMTGVVHVRKR